MNAVDTRPPFRPFVLYRWHDGTGVSGTGPVAFGIAWPDGRAVTRWSGATTGVQQISVWDSVEEIRRIHGHGGRTELRWLDQPATPAEALNGDTS